jgi:hypothetical protein
VEQAEAEAFKDVGANGGTVSLQYHAGCGGRATVNRAIRIPGSTVWAARVDSRRLRGNRRPREERVPVRRRKPTPIGQSHPGSIVRAPQTSADRPAEG